MGGSKDEGVHRMSTHQNASHLTQRTQGLLIRQQDVTEHLILTGSAFNPGVPGLLDTTQPSDWLHSCIMLHPVWARIHAVMPVTASSASPDLGLLQQHLGHTTQLTCNHAASR